MFALISPTQNAQYISSWDGSTPVYTVVGQLIAEISDAEFPVATPFYWVACDNTITQLGYGYNETTQQFVVIPPDEPKQLTSST
jgi:hypothetical protein